MSNNRPDTLQETFRKRGIKVKADTREPLAFVGEDSKTSFSAMADRLAERFTATDTDVAVLGEAYKSLIYEQQAGSGERTYEDVYGQTDFSKAVLDDPTRRVTLDEVFGNNDNDPTGSAGGLSVDEAAETIGQTGTTRNNQRTIFERHGGLYRAQTNTTTIRDEETAGIRAVNDIDAPIEPIA
jgi:hypothetical protein